MIKDKIWELLYRQWRLKNQERISGYSALLMLPGDLPVFFKIALEVLARQQKKHLMEVLIIPDLLTKDLRLVEDRHVPRGFEVPLRWVKMRPLDRLVIRAWRNPGHIHWLQHLRGIEASKTRYALVHDADLFITDDQFLKTHYEKCVDEKLACLGISPVWDPWYAQQNINHLVATWELMLDVEWFRGFEPWKHRGHRGVFLEQQHIFDTTLLPQCLTSPHRIGKHENFQGFIHFNYVVSTYRWFQKTKYPFKDEHFRLLLIRLLMMAYQMEEHPTDIPSHQILKKGLIDPTQPVTYYEVPENNYVEFREKIHALVNSELLDDDQKDIIAKNIAPFDSAFGIRGV